MQLLDPKDFQKQKKLKIELYVLLQKNKFVFSSPLTELLLQDTASNGIHIGISDTDEILFKLDDGYDPNDRGFLYKVRPHRTSGTRNMHIYNKQLCQFIRDRYGFEDEKSVKMLVVDEPDEYGFYTIIPRQI